MTVLVAARVTSRVRPVLRTILVAALVSVASWLSPLGTVGEADALTCGPAAPSRAAIAVVVDFGDSQAEGNCAAVPMTSTGSTSATGIDALRAAGYTLRIEGGFLCAIDGQPATGCATGSGFDGWYWRYFKAEPGKAWRYSSVGFGYRMNLTNGCAAEGWVWSDQPAGTTVPRGGVPSLRCQSLPVATTTTRVPATTAPPSPNPPKSPGSAHSGSPGGAVSGGTSSSGGAGPDAATGTDLQSGSSPGGAVDGSRGSAGDPAGGSEPFTGADGPDGPGEGAAAGAADAQVKGAAADSKAAESAESGRSSTDSQAASARRRRAASSGGSGSAVGVVVALVLVAGLGLFGVMKARGRRLAEKA